MKLNQQRMQLLFFAGSRRNYSTYQLLARAQIQASLVHTNKRSFGMPKYKFDHEDYEPNRFQVIIKSHSISSLHFLPLCELKAK